MLFLWLLISSFFLPLKGEEVAVWKPMELHYRIRPVLGHELEVQLTFHGNEQGETHIELPSSWAGNEDLFQQIHSVSSSSRICPTERPDIWTISHEPNAQVSISYHVQSYDPEQFYRPVIQPSYFHFFGHGVFALPIMEPLPIKVSIDWELPEGWNNANSHGVQQKHQDLELAAPFYLKHAIYVGGDIRLLRCGGKSAPIYIAMRGKWSFSDEQFIQLIETIFNTQREFWNDPQTKEHLITLFPSTGNIFNTGMALPKSFALFYRDVSPHDGQEWKTFVNRISHENFHTWNGNEMMPKLPGGSMYWFQEGFTEYYAYVLNLRSGLITPQDFQHVIRQKMHSYYTSSERNATNQRVEEYFFSDNPDLRWLPYDQGFLLALRWDKKIKQATHGTQSLDDVMRGLLQTVRSDGNPIIGREQIEERVSSLTGEDAAQDVEKYIIQGITIPFT